MHSAQKRNNLDTWNRKKKTLATNAITRPNMYVPLQRKIYWINFGENIGFELSDDVKNNRMHMGLVISKNKYNRSGTSIVAPITSGPCRNKKRILDCQLLLEKDKYDFLDKDCVVKFDQMRCVSTERIGNKKGFVDYKDWAKVEQKINTLFRMNVVDR